MPAKKANSPLRYAIGMFGTSIPVNMFKTYAAIFYVDKLSLINTMQFAQIMFIYTFLDAIDNPVYGILSDRTRTKWGRRRPWLIIGAPLLALSFVSFFNPPNLGPGSAFYFILLTYMFTGTLDSLINTNYGSLFPELFPSEAVRARTNAMRQAFQLVAMIISIALTPIVTDLLGYGLTSIVYGCLAVVVIVYMSLGCHEVVTGDSEPKPELLPAIRDIVTNPKFWIFGFANAFYSVALSLVLAAVTFFVKYTLNKGSLEATILQASVILVAIGGVAIWANLVKKRTLMPVWRIALIVLAASFVPLLFVNSFPLAIAGCCFLGFGVSGVLTTMDLIGAKIMDEDRIKHQGLRREGIINTTLGFMNRLSGLFNSLAFVLVGWLYGYKSGDEPGSNPSMAARFLMVIFPLGAMILSVIASRFLDFKDEPKQK
ncbi:MAG: MFS transporter [Clostridiales bacterium]|nr:MFS transporter [Clostridiales bacterium]